GLPPFLGFLPKWIIICSIIKKTNTWNMAIITTIFLISLYIMWSSVMLITVGTL
ncbi:hypothetical protein L9F63_019920, partial [Diploptera punctata]